MKYPLGSLDIEQLKDAVYDWAYLIVKGHIGKGQIIWRNQGRALPKRPCITMKIIDGPKSEHRSGSTFQSTNADGSTTVGQQMVMTVSIQVFGDTRVETKLKAARTAHQLALDLNSSLLQQTILDGLKADGLSVHDRGQPVNLTALEESEYEDRYGFEILFGCVQNVGDSPGYIKNVNGTLEASDLQEDFEVELP